jgi:16S rRNA (adenine1518-N6/adenine1519-N6)-dimethyltransferase
VDKKLTNPQYLSKLLTKHSLEPNPTLSQNFLICQNVVDKAANSLKESVPRVIELGAGLGTLTQALVEKGFQVRAIEKDEGLAEILEDSLGGQIEVVRGDLKKVEWLGKLPLGLYETTPPHLRGRKYQIIGNIPYHLSGLIIRRITQLNPAPVRVVLLTQKEVGERMRAEAPNMNLLGLAVQLWGRAEKLQTVPAGCFWPRPKVASQLTLLEPHQPRRWRGRKQVISEDKREALVKLAKVFFQQKRKQMGGRLRKEFKLEAEMAAKIWEKAGLAPAQRPQEVTPEQWEGLYDIIKEVCRGR